jgi:hypothetical protein
VPQQHERRQHRPGIEKHVTLEPRGHGHAVDPADTDRERNQHVHVKRALPERGNGAGEEHPRRPQHRQAQQQLPQLAVESERGCQLVAENALADARPRQDREREHQRH